MFSLEGKKILLTGASGGIGSETALLLSKLGATLVLSSCSTAKLESICKNLNGKHYISECDLSDENSAQSLVQKSIDMMDGLDCIICNAGVTNDKLIMRMSNKDWDSVININLRSSFILNREAMRHMIKQRYGRIINITSIVGILGNAGQVNYAASKAGMIGMTKSIAREIASRNVTANCIAPGFIDTPMTAALDDNQKDNINYQIPMGRMGEAVEVAQSIAFIASDWAKYITGQTIHVNGGMLMV